MTPTPHLTTPHLTTLREIEQEEDTAQAMQIREERLRQLRERFGVEQLRELHRVALRRQGLGHLAHVRPGDRLLSGVVVEESGWWLVESE